MIIDKRIIKFNNNFRSFMRRDKKQIVESNAEQVIVTAINLIELINETFDVETAADLNKRLINSIRTKDPRKFKRGIIKVEDSRHPGREL